MLSFGRQLVSRGLSPSVEGAGRPTVNSPRCLPTSKRDSRVVRKLWPKAILQSFGLALVDPSNRDAFRSTCFHRLFCPLAMGLKAVPCPPPWMAKASFPSICIYTSTLRQQLDAGVDHAESQLFADGSLSSLKSTEPGQCSSHCTDLGDPNLRLAPSSDHL